MENQNHGKTLRPLPGIGKVFPFFVPALMFVSIFFAPFSPLPLILYFERGGRKFYWLSLVVNALLTGVILGPEGALLFALIPGMVSLGIGEFLLSGKRKFDRALVYTYFLVLGGMAGAAGAYGLLKHVNPINEYRNLVSQAVDMVVDQQAKTGAAWDVSPDVMKKEAFVETPSAIGIFVLLVVWLNGMLILRLNPQGLQKKVGVEPQFFQMWKTPEWLVWPTLVSGGLLLLDWEPIHPFAINLFKILLAGYALQGLAIISFLFDVWQLKGILRTAVLVMVVMTVMPLVVALGFFDLWFDFRSKLRQS